MTPKELYKHIEIIYNHFDDFKSKMLIDNFIPFVFNKETVTGFTFN